MKFIGWILVVIFSLLLIADVLLLMMAIATGHQIPASSIFGFLIVAIILLALIFLTYRYATRKS